MREFKEEEKKKNWEKKKRKKKKKKEKESVKKEENKKSSYQILRSEMEGRNTALKRRRGEKKKIVEWKFQKELTFWQILKTFLIFTFTHFYFIPFTFTLHYVLIKSLFDLENCVVQILIWLRRKRCGVNIFGILSWDYLFFLD